MALSLPTGTLYALATVYAAAVPVTAGTNASEAVLTATNTFVAGDYVEYTGSWSRATNRVFRVKAPTGTTVTLEGLDTTSTALFPVGGATGSLRKITTWVPITQMISCEPSGGEPKFATVNLLDVENEISLPDGYGAQNLAMSIADDPALPHHAALKAAAELRKIAAIKAELPAGSKILYNGYISFDESPSMTKGQVMAVKAGSALQGRPVRYSA
ncbi:phage tail protein [Massilia sp. P8910]|uniref:Phage tail protein n=1 Tax=Massilia antarctica TaxID=2765360 RepID=A0AA49ABS3_9BURK|nr:phage tail protein [Massilia antarctica]MCE3605821.1 phage tail protein [Massilia antarctica]QPI52925.1 phage tail protein [Massilia antarctica]